VVKRGRSRRRQTRNPKKRAKETYSGVDSLHNHFVVFCFVFFFVFVIGFRERTNCMFRTTICWFRGCVLVFVCF
jgi:hypothetical protein